MAVVSLLEGPLSATYVDLFICGRFHCCLIDNSFLQTVSIHRALIFLLTVACPWLGLRAGATGGHDFAVMSSYDCFHVWGAAVTYLDKVSVEYFVELISGCEDSVYQL